MALQTQSVQIEEAIKEEFRILHQFLWEEETNKLKALKQEEETKVQVMLKKIKDAEKQIQTLSSNIRETETALRARELSFLQVLGLSVFAGLNTEVVKWNYFNSLISIFLYWPF